MEKTALITGADRGLGFGLTADLLGRGWRVYAGQYMPEWHELGELAGRYPGNLHIVPLDVTSTDSAQEAARLVGSDTDRIDLLVNNAGITSASMHRNIREELDYGEMQRMFNVNALGPVRVVEAFLPLVEKSEMKRLCFVSSESGSIERSHREGWYGYCMSKSALNMAISIMFNHLRKEGFTFRVYHPGWVRSYMGGTKNLEADLEPEVAAEYALAYFLPDLPDGEEDRLVMRDYEGNEWPW